MLRKAIITLLAVTLCSAVVPQAASACYGFACADVAITAYPFQRFYQPVSYTGFPGSAYGGFVVGCYPIRRPVLGLYGWQIRTVQVCE